jgi:hypothetical protein
VVLNLENDGVLSAAIEGLPKVVQLITAAPEEKRSLALAAARQSYLQTAQALGYEESDAQRWASTVMSLLEIVALASERAIAKTTAINKTQRISAILRCSLFPSR